MYNLEQNIFNKFFNRYFHTKDYNKDGNGKGVLQRFMETLASEWDEFVIAAAGKLIDNTLVPTVMLEKFIPYLEYNLGVPAVSTDMAIRRRVLARIISIYKCKGTLRSYKLIFNALGFDDVEVEQGGVDFGFDSTVTFDNDGRRFDMGKCYKCRYYKLKLYGALTIDNSMYQTILNAIKIVEPIYCRMYAVTLNDVDVNLVDIFIEENGDLVYSTLYEEQVGFTLAPNGDLKVYGTKANLFNLNNGNLSYND